MPRTSRGKAPESKVRKGFQRVGQDVQNAKEKIKQVDLESKVKADALASAVTKQGKRIGGNEYAMAATKVIDEIQTQFPSIKDDKILKTALPLVPLAFLKPPKKGSGVESLIKDPRVLGAAIAGAVAIYKGRDPDGPARMQVSPSSVFMDVGGTAQVVAAIVLDQKGNPVPGAEVTWQLNRPGIVQVDAASGTFTPIAEGIAVVTAKSKTHPHVSADVNVVVQPSGAAATPAAPSSIAFNQSRFVLPAAGDTATAAAFVLDANSDPIRGEAVTWSVHDPSIATVDPSGRITAVATGNTRLVATSITRPHITAEIVVEVK